VKEAPTLATTGSGVAFVLEVKAKEAVRGIDANLLLQGDRRIRVEDPEGFNFLDENH